MAGDTPLTSPTSSTPMPTVAPAAAPVETPTVTPEVTSGSGTPAPVTSQAFADAFQAEETRLKTVSHPPAPDTPSVEPTAMPATVETPETATPDTPPTADSDAEDDTPEAAATPPKAPGPVPLERHKRAVENARAKGAEEGRARGIDEVREYYPWVGKVDPRDIERGLALTEAIRRNPAGVAQKLLARSGGAAASDATPDLGVMPDPDLQTEDGKHKMYSESAHKRSLAILARRLGEAFQSEIADLRSFVAEQREGTARAQTEQVVSDRVEALMKMPGADQYLEEIVTLMESDRRLSDVGAYNRIVPAKLAEEVARLKSEHGVAEARLKAGAGALNPSGAGTGTTGKRTHKATTEGFMRAFEEASR